MTAEAALRPWPARNATVVEPVPEAWPPLALDEVSKRWRKDEPPVLDRLDFVLDAGTTVWLRGPNGVGKTTLLRIAAGLITPDAGTVTSYGLHPERDRANYQRGIGFLPAGDRGLYARLSVRRNLELWAALALIPKRERREAVQRVTGRFTLEGLMDRRVDRLSMGQRQRVRLAMVFLHQPSVVLLDEPGTSLDDRAFAMLSTALVDHMEGGGAAVWCSPAGEQARFDFDQTYLMGSGGLQEA